MAKIKRDYQNDYPSVTTALGVLRKIGLEYWFKNNTRAFCDAAAEKGKLIGTQIHQVIENHIKGIQEKVDTEYTEEVTNALKSYLLFRKDNPDLDLEWSEVIITSNRYGYNGTLDCLAKKLAMPILLDWKTGECKKKEKPDIYDEYKYQVAAYVIGYNEDQFAKSLDFVDVKQAMIVSFAKDKVAYTTYVMDWPEIEAHFHNGFLPALTIYKHQKNMGYWNTVQKPNV